MSLSEEQLLSSDAIQRSVVKSCTALVPNHPPLLGVSPQGASHELSYTPKLPRWNEIELPERFKQLRYEQKESWVFPRGKDMERLIQIHDFLYTRGSQYAFMTRDQANFILYQAIVEKDPVLASVYWAATQLFGDPFFRLPLKADAEAGPEGFLLQAAPPVTNIAYQCVIKLLRSEAEKLQDEAEVSSSTAKATGENLERTTVKKPETSRPELQQGQSFTQQ